MSDFHPHFGRRAWRQRGGSGPWSHVHVRTAPPELILRSEALRQGFSSDEVQVKRRRREWIALRAGGYVPAAAIKASAACLLGIDLWDPILRAVQLTRPGSGGGHRRRSLHTFRAALPPEDVVVVGGYRVTSPARTIVDLGRYLPFEAAVVAADSALHAEVTTAGALAAAAERQARRPGIRSAHRVIAFADARSESVGESRTRVMIHRAALPLPELQYVVRSPEGVLLGRADFGWEQLNTLGEFDGREKYGRRLRPGQQPGDAVFHEKLREDAMRDGGWQFVRLTWADLDHPEDAVKRIKRALERGERQRRSPG